MFDKVLIEKERNAVLSPEGKAITERAQRFIEKQATNTNMSSDIVRGAVLLLKNIKEAVEDFDKAKKNS